MNDQLADGKPSDRLTGRERFLRGMRYFAWVSGAGLAWCLVFFSTATFPPGKRLAPVFAQFVLVFCLLPGMLAGLCAMSFRKRRPWQWLLVAVVAGALWAAFMGLA